MSKAIQVIETNIQDTKDALANEHNAVKEVFDRIKENADFKSVDGVEVYFNALKRHRLRITELANYLMGLEFALRAIKS
jgi:rubrerythrin